VLGHIAVSENSPIRRYLLYVFARYIEMPLLKICYHLLRGKWRWLGSKPWFKKAVSIVFGKPFGYLGDTGKPMPYGEVIKYIDELDGPIAVGNCRCRLSHQACDHPLKTDIVMRTGYNAWTKAFPTDYRPITKDEAKSIVTTCHQNHMFHMVFVHCPVNLYNEYVICNCCTCGCVPYIINRDLGQLNYPLIDGYYLAITDKKKCKACGDCVTICPFDARRMVKNIGRTAHNCFGCGLCAYHCTQGAISMKQLRDPLPRDEHGHPPLSYKPSFYKQHQPCTEKIIRHSSANLSIGEARASADKRNDD
jgi:ferredoxin